MDFKNSLAPIIGDMVKEAMKDKDPAEIDEMRKKITDSILQDSGAGAKIDELVKKEKAPAPSEEPPPDAFSRVRALVRPMITILLAGTFIFLIVFPFFFSFLGIDPKTIEWDKIFSAFMGVFVRCPQK